MFTRRRKITIKTAPAQIPTAVRSAMVRTRPLRTSRVDATAMSLRPADARVRSHGTDRTERSDSLSHRTAAAMAGAEDAYRHAALASRTLGSRSHLAPG